VRLLANPGFIDVYSEPALIAADTGKAVLCEKTLATTSAEARSMTSATQSTGIHAVYGARRSGDADGRHDEEQ
jgi:predicted dehydrogenase